MFLVTAVINNHCDKCNKLGSETNPIIQFRESTRIDCNVIFICHKCLVRGTDKALEELRNYKTAEAPSRQS